MLTPNYPAWKFWLDLLQLAGTLGVAGYVWWSNREKVTSQRFATLEKEVADRAKKSDLDAIKDEIGTRVRRTDLDVITSLRDKWCETHKLEIKEFEKLSTTRLGDTEMKVERIGAEIRNLPQHRHITDLSSRIEQIHGDVHEVSGSLKGISRAVDLINEFLINRGK